MNPATAALMPKFFVICGVVLVLSGVGQALVRPRKQRETQGQKWINPATMKAVLFVTVGVLGILVGVGIIPIPRAP